MAIRSFHADIFEIEAKTERELQLKAKNERILDWRRALENGPRRFKSPHMMSGSVWPGSKKGKSSPDGVTAEMLLALPEEQISRLARHMQDVFSSLNFQETWFRVMASLIPKKHIREESTSSVPSA